MLQLFQTSSPMLTGHSLSQPFFIACHCVKSKTYTVHLHWLEPEPDEKVDSKTLQKKNPTKHLKNMDSVWMHLLKFYFILMWSTWSGIIDTTWKSAVNQNVFDPTVPSLTSASVCLITWLQRLNAHCSCFLVLLSQAPFFSLSGKMPERCSESHAPLPALVIWQRAERVQNNWNSIYVSMWQGERESSTFNVSDWKKGGSKSEVPGIVFTSCLAKAVVG